jgi:hypothetical protein
MFFRSKSKSRCWIGDRIGLNSEKKFNNQLPSSFVNEVLMLVSEKVMRFQGKNKDLNQLSQQIVQQLESEGYKTQLATPPLGIVIQAKKAGILRDIITADRAFSILITGQPNDFSVHIGIGKWIQNLAVAAVETLLLTWLFLAIDVPEMLWTRHVENTVAKEITQIIG